MGAIASIISAIIAAAGLLVAWREKSLRRGEVLAWANEGIAELQTIELLCDQGSPLWDDPERLVLLQRAIVNTSVLVERGRLFFRNKPWGDWGKEQEPAYRGLRPIVLDQLVLGHQIACALNRPDESDPRDLKKIAERARKRFVSLCQREVGRSRSASTDPAKAGQSVDLLREIALLELRSDTVGRRAA